MNIRTKEIAGGFFSVAVEVNGNVYHRGTVEADVNGYWHADTVYRGRAMFPPAMFSLAINYVAGK